MRTKPISFSASLAQAVHEVRKTQTRRVIVPQPRFDAQGCTNAGMGGRDDWWDYWSSDRAEVQRVKAPFAVGDRLWVREPWSATFWNPDDIDGPAREFGDTPKEDRVPDFLSDIFYQGAEQSKPAHRRFIPEQRWQPSRFMFRWAARTHVIVSDVRALELNEIGEDDAAAEGCELQVECCGKPNMRVTRFADSGEALECEPECCGNPDIVEPLAATFARLWNELHAEPRPMYRRGKIIGYVSYPWEPIRETREKAGKAWYVIGNPFVFAYTFHVEKPEAA